jgi:hypothetical protein
MLFMGFLFLLAGAADGQVHHQFDQVVVFIPVVVVASSAPGTSSRNRSGEVKWGIVIPAS